MPPKSKLASRETKSSRQPEPGAVDTPRKSKPVAMKSVKASDVKTSNVEATAAKTSSAKKVPASEPKSTKPVIPTRASVKSVAPTAKPKNDAGAKKVSAAVSASPASGGVKTPSSARAKLNDTEVGAVTAPKTQAKTKIQPTKDTHSVKVSAPVKAAAKSVPEARKVSEGKVSESKGTNGTVQASESKIAEAGAPVVKAAVKSSTTRNVAAAFVAARQKMAPVAKPVTAGNNEGDALKGTVEVTDKMVKQNAPEAQMAPPVAEKPFVPAPRPAMPHGAPAAARVIKPTVAPKGQGFKTLEYIVYPAHGVGQIVAIEEQEVAGYKLELFVISFIKDKMILKVPLPKIASVGMRKLAEAPVVKRALDTLMGRARVKRTMWSRRAQEYEAKINSGDLVAIAEVVRDLYRSDAQPEQSYSERQLYEAALDRMAREIAVVQKLTDQEALKLIDEQLQKGPRRTKADEAEAEDSEEETTAGIGEAA